MRGSEIMSMHKPRKITSVDVKIGERIRYYRTAKGVSQIALGEKLGVSFQQIQKYERGTNRICARQIPVISDMLEVSVTTLLGRDADADLCPDERRDIMKLGGSSSGMRLVRIIMNMPIEKRNQLADFLSNYETSIFKPELSESSLDKRLDRVELRNNNAGKLQQGITGDPVGPLGRLGASGWVAQVDAKQPMWLHDTDCANHKGGVCNCSMQLPNQS
jgi:transcriptional regulator with XRE-family HTH domain